MTHQPPIAAMYLELRYLSPISLETSNPWEISSTQWLKRIQVVFATGEYPSHTGVPGPNATWARVYSRGLQNGAVRSSWRTSTTTSIPSTLEWCPRDADPARASGSMAMAMLIAGIAPQLRKLGSRSPDEFREYDNHHLGRPMPDVLRDMFRTADKWHLIKPTAYTIPNTADNHTKLVETRDIAPWPVLQRAKKRYAAHGIEI